MRIALHSIVRDGLEEGYDSTHARVPDDLVASFARVGIRDWTIWRSGRHLFHLVECDDFTAALDALDTDPANAAWQRTIGPFVDHFEVTGPGNSGMPIPEVWRLTEQRSD
jgi:L-rhamnose mutarotase